MLGCILRRFRFRAVLAIPVIAVVVVAAAACGSVGQPDGPDATVRHFTQLLDKHDAAGAASLTTYPSAASATIRQIFDGLQNAAVDYRPMQVMNLDPDTSLFNLDVNWDFGKNKQWSYNLEGRVRKLAVGWRISWDPAVVMPQLDTNHTVQLVRTTPSPAPKVVDIAGAPLMQQETINQVKLDPARMPDPVRSTDALAKAIAPVAPLITGEDLRAQLAAAGGKPITAVNLRDGDFAILQPRMAPIPGVVMTKDPQLVASDRRVTSPLLDALRSEWQQSQDEHSGWAVQLVENGKPPKQLAGQQGPAGPDIASALDQRLQRAAEDAVASAGVPTSIVVVQPSSGAVVADAQNTYASQASPAGSFTDSVPLGGTQELLRSAAAVAKNKAPQNVSASEMGEAAKQLGIGVNFRVAGLRQETGEVTTGGNTDHVRQGGNADPVTASVFGMALAAAAIDRGSVPTPLIERGKPGSADAPPAPLSGPVVDRLRGMFRDGMNDPRMASLRGYRDVAGCTATAGGDEWLLATMGDMAFAVHIANADGGDMAAKVATRMMRSMIKPDA